MKTAMFVVMALTGVLAAPAAAQKPQIDSKYEATRGCCGPFPFALTPHSGVDFGGPFGEEVLAPADGEVTHNLNFDPKRCGKTLVLHHKEFNLYTVYCHFQDVKVRAVGSRVKRGDVIGTLGDSGMAADCRPIRPCAIVHVEVSKVPWGHPRAKPGETYDFLDYSVGCFDPDKIYPTDRLALTYPVRCR
jgi:hypothetical protein